MNANKCAEELQRIFHLENCTGEDGNYELSSNYWGLKFNVRIRKFTIFIIDNLGGAKCSIDYEEDNTTIARELIAFIGMVIKDESEFYTYDGTSGILAWPYNCNLAYVDYLKQAMDMGADENIYEYEIRKRGLNSSKKPIKSTYDNEIYRQAFGALLEDYPPSKDLPGGYRVLVDGNYETEFSAESREDAIQKFKDYFANKKKGINNSKKPIKSSESSWDNGYNAFSRGEGYADYPTGLSDRDAEDWMSGWDYANREDKGELTELEQQVWSEDDEERLRGEFADMKGIDLNEDEFPEEEYERWTSEGAAMYSSKTRNQSSLNKIFS